MSNYPKPHSQVHISNVEVGIYGSITNEFYIVNDTIIFDGQPTSASKEPTVDDLKHLLAQVHKELTDLMT